ncbi:MAG: type III-B CRISPR module RAMP protein Cmr4 [Candidatus Methanomethylicaceae archaeon]
MFKKADILFFYTETPLHAGSGTSVSVIDLPIQRETYTNYPLIQASGVKGSVRDLVEHLQRIPQLKRQLGKIETQLSELAKNLTAEEQENKTRLEQEKTRLQNDLETAKRPVEIVFGPETDRASEHGGALSFTDARILLFPVRSLKGVFAWITCPTVLERFKRDLSRIELVSGNSEAVKVPEKEKLSSSWDVPSEDKAFITNDCIAKTQDGGVILEDFAFQADMTRSEDVQNLGMWLANHVFPQAPAGATNPVPDPYRFWRDRLPKALVIVHDDVFRDFVEFSTEVITRIAIEETGTVKEGALWNEEHLPSDALLYSVVLATDPKLDGGATGLTEAAHVIQRLAEWIHQSGGVMQLGGDETVGRGIVRAQLLLSAAAPANQQTQASPSMPTDPEAAPMASEDEPNQSKEDQHAHSSNPAAEAGRGSVQLRQKGQSGSVKR